MRVLNSLIVRKIVKEGPFGDLEKYSEKKRKLSLRAKKYKRGDSLVFLTSILLQNIKTEGNLWDA